jgi:DNA-binding transcriptional ArsR family regulator
MSLIAELFEKISHPTRLKILNLLQDNPMNFTQLKTALSIESNGNLDHHLKKLDTLIYLDQSGLYKLSDDGKEALRAVQVMEASVNAKKETTASTQGTKVFYSLLAITCVLPVSVVAILIWSSSAKRSPATLSVRMTVLITMSIGLVVAVRGIRRTIKADTISTEQMTYFPSRKDPWCKGDWLRNVGFFSSYLAAFLSLIYIQLSPIEFPGKTPWVVVTLVVLGVLGYTAQTLIYGIIAKANRRIRSAQNHGATMSNQN